MKESILSVGIDIGTSTTQMIFCRLTIENLANAYSVPRIVIVDKEVVYRSGIYFTPLSSASEIDGGSVRRIIEKEYQKAGFAPEEISTGAVIITGETARKKNAGEVLEALSGMAGDFVVAAAGPDLESVLAARGAGADSRSKEIRGTVANIDIGGGTSNIAVYKNGELAAAACLDIGGRLVKVEEGKISYIYEKTAALARNHGIILHTGEPADEEKLGNLCSLMADQLAQSLNLGGRTGEHAALYTNEGRAIPPEIVIDGLMLSGGVADCCFNDVKDCFCYQDIGVLLGRAIREHPKFKNVQLFRAAETIRATVIGAGTHTTTVSGSTISVSGTALPIKNIPVLKISPEDEKDAERFSSAIEKKISIYFSDGEEKALAVAFEGGSIRSYREVKEAAKNLIRGAYKLLDSPFPLIIIVEKDIAKVLGNIVMNELGGGKDVICLDSIHAEDGSYIDIGEPLVQGNVVPVIVKTLIFNS